MSTLGGRLTRIGDTPVSQGGMTGLPWACGEGARVLPFSWSPDGQRIACVCPGRNGQLLGGLTIHDLASSTRRAAVAVQAGEQQAREGDLWMASREAATGAGAAPVDAPAAGPR